MTLSKSCLPAAACVGLLFAGSPVLAGDASPLEIGQKSPSFAIKEVAGRAGSLDQIAGKHATLLVFVSTECPMANSYLEPLGELAASYRDRGVAVILINANNDEGEAAVAAHAKEFKLTLSVVKDADQSIADLFGARVTPEAFLLDADRVLRYRGRIDDQYAARLRRRERVTRHDLREAIDEVLAGKTVSVPVTEALGCPIARPALPKKAATAVTFNRDIMPILQNRCQDCHRPGQVAPFSLMNYRQAVKWAADMETAVEERIIPPWRPVAGFGEFRDEARLTDDEIRTIAGWVEAGTPEGDSADLPPPREFPAGGWTLGQPDLVLTMQEEYELYASGRDVLRQFVIPTGVTEDKWVTAVEFRPGNPRIAHHAIFFTDTSGRARELDAEDPEPGFRRLGFLPSGVIGGWAVGTRPAPLPDGVGMRLEKNSDLVVQMHYHPSGRPERDRSTIGIYFADKPAKKQVVGVPVFGFRWLWPAGDERIQTTGRFKLPVDAHAISVFPHMHLLGTEFKMTAHLPDGSTQPLIYIDKWDFNWQQPYIYKEPVPLPAGTRIELDAYADNSANNPNNPNSPPQAVRFGEQSTDEMCIGFVGCTVDNDADLLDLFRLRARRRLAEDFPKKSE